MRTPTMATATPSRCCDGPNKQLLDRWPTHSSSWWKNGVFTLRRCKGARMSYEIVGGKERANAKKNLRRGLETKSVMSMVLDAAGTDELPQASRRCHCRCRTFLAPNQSQPPRLQVLELVSKLQTSSGRAALVDM